jgi:hypothetical protein
MVLMVRYITGTAVLSSNDKVLNLLQLLLQYTDKMAVVGRLVCRDFRLQGAARLLDLVIN